MGMEMARRPNSGGAKTAKDGGRISGDWDEKSLKENNEIQTFGEPVWVWKKN